MSLTGLSLETATRRTGGPEEGLADSTRESMEEMFEWRCFARARGGISAVSGSFVSVMISLGLGLVRRHLESFRFFEAQRKTVSWTHGVEVA